MDSISMRYIKMHVKKKIIIGITGHILPSMYCHYTCVFVQQGRKESKYSFLIFYITFRFGVPSPVVLDTLIIPLRCNSEGHQWYRINYLPKSSLCIQSRELLNRNEVSLRISTVLLHHCSNKIPTTTRPVPFRKPVLFVYGNFRLNLANAFFTNYPNVLYCIVYVVIFPFILLLIIKC